MDGWIRNEPNSALYSLSPSTNTAPLESQLLFDEMLNGLKLITIQDIHVSLLDQGRARVFTQFVPLKYEG